MAVETDKALDEVKKIVGKKFKAQKLEAHLKQLDSVAEEFNKTIKPFKGSVDALEKTILAMQNANSKLINSLKQIGNTVDGSDFGLDPKSDDDKKTIAKCQKILDDAIATIEKTSEDQNKKLDEMDKHLDNISNYKSPS